MDNTAVCGGYAGNGFTVDARGFLHKRMKPSVGQLHAQDDQEPPQELHALELADKFVSGVASEASEHHLGHHAPAPTKAAKRTESSLDVIHAEATKDEEIVARAATNQRTFREQLDEMRAKLEEQGDANAKGLSSSELSNGHVRHVIIADIDSPLTPRGHNVSSLRGRVRESHTQHAAGFPGDTCWICAEWRPVS